MIDDKTLERLWPLPHPTNLLKDDVLRLRQAFTMGDADTAFLLNELLLKSNVGHHHPISDVDGLPAALDGKAAFDHVHGLNDLTDVDTTAKATGQVLMWQTSAWLPISLQIASIVGLETALAAKASITSVDSKIAAAKTEILGGAGPAFDTLIELAAALGNDPNFAASMSALIADRPTIAVVDAALALKANAANAQLTGTAVVAGVHNLTTASAAQLTISNPTPTPAEAFAGIRFLHDSTYDRRFGMTKTGVIGIFAAAAGGAQAWGVDASGNMTAAGNVSAYSDERLKTNVVQISGALDTLLQAEGYFYDRNGKRETGIIAQNLHRAIPELVNRPDNPDEYWSVKHANALGFIIEAFRDVSRLIGDLRVELDDLKQRL